MGGMINYLESVSTTIGAIASIVTILIAFEKWSKGKLSKWLLKSVKDDIASLKIEIQELKEHLKKVELDDLKLVIMSEEMPIRERLAAGKRYVSQGRKWSN